MLWLRIHALDFKESYPAAATVLLRDMYVDDILHLEETEEHAVLVREDLKRHYEFVGMRVKMFSSYFFQRNQPVLVHEAKPVKSYCYNV